jgi:hypothetical protein
MLSVDRTDLDVIAVFHQNFGESKRKTVDAIDVTLNEKHSTGLVSYRQTIGELWSSPEPEQDRLFMVRPGNTRTFREAAFPFIGSLIVDAIKNFVKDGLYDRPKVC